MIRMTRQSPNPHHVDVESFEPPPNTPPQPYPAPELPTTDPYPSSGSRKSTRAAAERGKVLMHLAKIKDRPATINKPFCPLCLYLGVGEIFADLAELMIHLVAEHGVRGAAIAKVSHGDKSLEYKCDLCGEHSKSFKKLVGLQTHLKTNPLTHNALASNRILHKLRGQAEGNQFPCPIENCYRSFDQCRGLETHIGIKHGSSARDA